MGAPFEKSGTNQTGDVYRCPLDSRTNTNCSRLNLGTSLDSWWKILWSQSGITFLLKCISSFVCLLRGEISLKNVLERKDRMSLGMSLASNPKDNSFVVGVVYIIALVKHKEIWMSVQLNLQSNKTQRLHSVL